MAAHKTTWYSDEESKLSFLYFKVTYWAMLYCINEFVWTWTKRNPNLTSFLRKSHNVCDAKAYAPYHVYSQYGSLSVLRRYTCTVLLHSSTCKFYISRSYVQLHAMPYFLHLRFVCFILKIHQIPNILWPNFLPIIKWFFELEVSSNRYNIESAIRVYQKCFVAAIIYFLLILFFQQFCIHCFQTK